jgi:hypothetical protein
MHAVVKFRREKECLWQEIRVSEKLLLITSRGMYVSISLSRVQVGNYIHYMSMFMTGFAVGFSAERTLALVTLAVVPAIGITGSFHAALFTGHSKSQQEYWEAGSIAEQVCVFFSSSLQTSCCSCFSIKSKEIAS